MAAHSSVLAWRIPGTGEPGGLPSMGSHRVGHDWSDLAVAAAWLIHVELWQKTTKFCKEIILQLKKLYFHMSGVISLFFWLHLIWKSQGCPRSPLLLNMISEVLAVASRDDKKWKDPSWKEVKLALFADGMILDIEKPKDATRKLLELINKLVNFQDTRLIPSDFLNGIWECICCLLISQKLLLLLFWYFKSNLFLKLSVHPLLG